MTERLMNVLRGAGSILDLWPVPPGLEDLSPHDAEEMFRRCWTETGAALRGAMNEVGRGSKPEQETQEEETVETGQVDMARRV